MYKKISYRLCLLFFAKVFSHLERLRNLYSFNVRLLCNKYPKIIHHNYKKIDFTIFLNNKLLLFLLRSIQHGLALSRPTPYSIFVNPTEMMPLNIEKKAPRETDFRCTRRITARNSTFNQRRKDFRLFAVGILRKAANISAQLP